MWCVALSVVNLKTIDQIESERERDERTHATNGSIDNKFIFHIYCETAKMVSGVGWPFIGFYRLMTANVLYFSTEIYPKINLNLTDIINNKAIWLEHFFRLFIWFSFFSILLFCWSVDVKCAKRFFNFFILCYKINI